MPFALASRRASPERLERDYPGAEILDLTSHAPEPWVCFSPFYPHGGIPVPFSPGEFGASVEGIWQGLKVFAGEDIDPSKWRITTMKNIKRTERAKGKTLGHRAGVNGERLLGYAEARRAIYLPAYQWVLENRLQDEVATLRRLGMEKTVVLLDYETNGDVDDLRRPLSHASLVARHIEGNWPG